MSAETLPPFSVLVSAAMARRGLGLRELCRQVKVDPSFLSKVLTGKRNPPSDDDILRRMAAVLETDAVKLFVAAGRIPTEWRSLTLNPELLRRVDALANSGLPRVTLPLPSKSVPSTRSSTPPPYSPKPFNEELL